MAWVFYRTRGSSPSPCWSCLDTHPHAFLMVFLQMSPRNKKPPSQETHFHSPSLPVFFQLHFLVPPHAVFSTRRGPLGTWFCVWPLWSPAWRHSNCTASPFCSLSLPCRPPTSPSRLEPVTEFQNLSSQELGLCRPWGTTWTLASRCYGVFRSGSILPLT